MITRLTVAEDDERLGYDVPDRTARFGFDFQQVGAAAMRLQITKSLLLALGPAMLVMSACGPAGPNNRAPSPADAAEGSEKISSRHFGRLTVPCREPDAMARALLALTGRDLAEGTRTRLLDHSSDDVRLKDGSGKIVAIVYSISEEDDDSVITTSEHFLVNQSCQVLHWRSAVNIDS